MAWFSFETRALVARAALVAKMSMLAYPKGTMWVHRNGVDVTLGGSGSKRRANNNGLTCIQEEEPEKIEYVVHVVRGIGAKGKGANSSVGDIVGRVPLPLNWPLCVGTLENGYVRNVPLPRIPQIQSTNQIASVLACIEPAVSCYARIAWIPTYSKLMCSPEGFGTIPIVPFFPLVG